MDGGGLPPPPPGRLPGHLGDLPLQLLLNYDKNNRGLGASDYFARAQSPWMGPLEVPPWGGPLEGSSGLLEHVG